MLTHHQYRRALVKSLIVCHTRDSTQEKNSFFIKKNLYKSFIERHLRKGEGHPPPSERDPAGEAP
jgi:hypothetical protein